MEESAVLPSWNDGPAKAAILDFVRSVTAPGEEFVPPDDRIVTFDPAGEQRLTTGGGTSRWCSDPKHW